jgi:hypothetical protein
MWDGLDLSTIICLATAAVAVGGGLGLLRQSKARTVMIAAWAALPAILVAWAISMAAVDAGQIDLPASVGFAAVFTMLLQPPWALLTLFPFNIVRRVREIARGSDYANGS